MRPTVIAGNWKMNKSVQESVDLIRALLAKRPSPLNPHLQLIVCPPFTSLSVAADLLRGTGIHLGAQNMSEQDDGAFTGEISWKMVKSIGCTHVILGHSERRQFFGESDALVNRKARKALATGLTPIVCVGETLDERERGVTADVVSRQMRGVLEGISASTVVQIIFAYEPIWAIGTGRNATPDQAQGVHAQIREILSVMYGKENSASVVIQYGGSVKPENAGEILAQPDVDGALVGGASLSADSFWGIVLSRKA